MIGYVSRIMNEDAHWQDELQPIGSMEKSIYHYSFDMYLILNSRGVGIHRRAPSSATFVGKQKPTLRIAVRE